MAENTGGLASEMFFQMERGSTFLFGFFRLVSVKKPSQSSRSPDVRLCTSAWLTVLVDPLLRGRLQEACLSRRPEVVRALDGI